MQRNGNATGVDRVLRRVSLGVRGGHGRLRCHVWPPARACPDRGNGSVSGGRLCGVILAAQLAGCGYWSATPQGDTAPDVWPTRTPTTTLAPAPPGARRDPDDRARQAARPAVQPWRRQRIADSRASFLSGAGLDGVAEARWTRTSTRSSASSGCAPPVPGRREETAQAASP